jgi:hypothetical protein
MKAGDMHEGVEAFNRFKNAVKAVMSVPKHALPPRPTRTPKSGGKRKH